MDGGLEEDQRAPRRRDDMMDQRRVSDCRLDDLGRVNRRVDLVAPSDHDGPAWPASSRESRAVLVKFRSEQVVVVVVAVLMMLMMKLLQLLMIVMIMACVLRTVVGAEVGEVGQRLDKSVMVEALIDVRERPAEVSLLPAVQAIPPRRAAILRRRWAVVGRATDVGVALLQPHLHARDLCQPPRCACVRRDRLQPRAAALCTHPPSWPAGGGA